MCGKTAEMANPTWINDAIGEWSGLTNLHLSWLPEDQKITESSSSLVLKSGCESSFITLNYDWMYEGKTEQGVLIACRKNSGDEATGGWTDSWHMSGAVMSLVGTGSDSKPLKLSGEYAVEGHPNWGWRLELSLTPNGQLSFKMFNISPEGDEEWAVDAIYDRA